MQKRMRKDGKSRNWKKWKMSSEARESVMKRSDNVDEEAVEVKGPSQLKDINSVLASYSTIGFQAT